MAMTLQELEKIRYALVYGLQRRSMYAYLSPETVEDAIEIVYREINQMKQDQLLSESKANPA